MSENEEIIRRRVVEQMTGLKRSAIYEGIQEGRFPRQVKLGPRAVGWRKSDIVKWISERPAA